MIAGMVCAAVLASQNVMAEKLPLDYFFKNPQFAGFQVSPNGKELAALANVDGRMNIVVMDLKDRQPRVVTGMRENNVNGFVWANDERLLFFMDKDGSESGGLFAINTDGSKLRTLVEPVISVIKGGSSKVIQTQIMNTLDDEPEWILVSSNERRAAWPDVFRMNIYTGRTKIVERNPGKVVGWAADWDGNVLGAGYTDELYNGFLRLVDAEEDEYEEMTRARFDEASWSPAGFKEDTDIGWVQSNLTPDGQVRDKAAIYEFNFETKEFGKLVYEHDQVDCCALIMNEKLKDAIGVSWMVGKPERVYFNERWKNIMAGIDQALPDTVNVVSSLDDEETVGVVTAYSDVQPPKYYLYDFQTNQLEWLTDSRPWVDASKMSEMKHYSFTSRDGMTMHGYITIPKGSDGKNLPLIVNPHGGPEARDGWGYNPEHQFLANRGYVVLQVNFRGSTGFGRDHWKAHFKNWGQAMQNDVTDAVKWAIGEGIADEDRVCIYGGSYGGYATMAGLTYTPDMYKCGINYVGVTDLAQLFKSMPDAWESQKYIMAQKIGDPETEEEFLEQWSPSNHADRIKAPVFMAYGLQDPRVTIDHLHLMESAMKKAGVEYESMVKRDEGHGYRKEENRYEFYGKMESFLAEHLNPEAVANVNP
jgi:dienelactone hydrolase